MGRFVLPPQQNMPQDQYRREKIFFIFILVPQKFPGSEHLAPLKLIGIAFSTNETNEIIVIAW